MTFSRRSTEYVFGIILKVSVFSIVAHLLNLAIAIICVYVCHKFKPILYTLLELKDLKKTRLVNTHQKNLTFNVGEFLDEKNKNGYRRLCEEQFFQALIGCELCDKKTASYILNRQDVLKAINMYHRVKYDVKVEDDGSILPKKDYKDLTIKAIEVTGSGAYFLLSFLAFIPLFVPVVSAFLNIQLPVNWQVLPFVIFYMITLFASALFVLNESYKPKRVKAFCALETFFDGG